MIASFLVERLHPQHTLLFPDADDERTIAACSYLLNNNLCKPMLVGNQASLQQKLLQLGFPQLSNNIVDVSDVASQTIELLSSTLQRKNPSAQELADLSNNPLYAAGALVAAGEAAGVVAGSLSTTADVLKAALATVRLDASTKTMSSFFLMCWPDGRKLTFTDCGVVPQPTAEQLADIAASASANHQKLTGETPNVAFLSFSTKGSANHPAIDHVRTAAQLFAERYPHIVSDGELQLDAAIVPEVAQQKAPLSPLNGNANVLVFPDLNSGNIAYKMAQRLAGADAYGPIVQGLAHPYCDLSRGCSSDDIINVAAITSIMASN